MAHVYALVNQKGGVGKTTSAIHIAVGLQNRKYKTLIIDMDAQCNLTFSLGGDYQNSPTILEAVTGKVKIEDCIQHLAEVDLIPGSFNMCTIDTIFKDDGKEYFLKDAIKPLLDKYDYIVIDSPPALSLSTVAVMCAANSLVVPVEMELYSLQGTGQLYRTYKVVKKYCNPELVIDGLLLSNFSFSFKEYFYETAKKMNCRILHSAISNGSVIKHAVFAQQSIYKYSPNSRQAQEYNSLVDELLQIRNSGEEFKEEIQEEIKEETFEEVKEESIDEVIKPNNTPSDVMDDAREILDILKKGDLK